MQNINRIKVIIANTFYPLNLNIPLVLGRRSEAEGFKSSKANSLSPFTTLLSTTSADSSLAESSSL